MKKALILGICGQDGSYLAELLLSKSYEVIGIYRRTSSPNFSRIENIKDDLTLVEGDISDYFSLHRILGKYQPDEIYNLAAQSHVKSSFEQPVYTTSVDYLGCLNILEAIRNLGLDSKFYQASTSEMYGSSYNDVVFETKKYKETFQGSDITEYILKKAQNELTPFMPNSPYAIAKLAAHHLVRLYRESYKIFACSGILFNHESPRRGEEFVTKKITNWLQYFMLWKKKLDEKETGGYNFDFKITSNMISVVRHNKNKSPYGHKESWLFGAKFPKLKLGNIYASRDWGFAGDYVDGMWRMLQQERPDDYVLATGETHTVEEFLKEAFSLYNLNFKDYVEYDSSFERPSEVPYLCGDASKAKRILGWEPKVKFKELVRMMVDDEKRS